MIVESEPFNRMAHPPIKAVFLDAGKTLFTEREERAAIYARLASEFGGQDDPELAAELMSRGFSELPKIIDGHFRFSLEWFRSFNAQILGELGVSADAMADAHDRTVAVFEDPATYRLFDDVPAFLESLREFGVTVGVVSNWSERLPVLCQGLGIDGYLDFISASAEIKSEKPERECFQRALFRAGTRGEETVHVGDHPNRDVRGALEAGLRAVLLHRDPQGEPPSMEGVTTVTSLTQLASLLSQAVASTPSA